MYSKSAATLFGGISFLALATAAQAQEARPTQGSEVESVVVTATRIQSSGFTAPTPVTVATAQQLSQTTPSNIPEALNKLPIFAGSTTTANSGTGPANIYTGNFLNLRSMGSIRTLILLDGRRVPATATSGAVDTNTLPQMLVQRVDVVTGGASAVYGSDAVTGVVNFVLDTRFKGFKANVQTGISDRGDAPASKFGFAGGTSLFGGRGHFIFSAEHYQSAGIKRNEDREASASINVYQGAGTAQNPYSLMPNARISTMGFGGLVTSGPFTGQQFVNGVLRPFNPGTSTRTAGLSAGGDGAYLYDSPVRPPLRYDQVFGRFEYDLSDNVSGFMQLSWSESGNSNYHQAATPGSTFTIFSGNPFLPADAQAALTAGGAASFTMNRYMRDLSLRSTLNQLVSSLGFTTGLKGKVFDNFNWEAYYTHGEVRVRSRRENNTYWPKFYAALDAVRDPSGKIVCRVDLTNPGLYPGCKPINMFGELNQSAEALDYVQDTTWFSVLNKMENFAASVSGDVWQGWAGPLSVAANFEYRQQSMQQASTANPNDPINLTGIRIGALPRSTWIFDLLAPQAGQNSVWEVSGEAALPLLVDKTFIKRFDVTGALRYTQYSSSGPATTWKVGLNYVPFDDLRLRYTESRDIRAPTLADLYSGDTVSGVALNDPHTGRTGNTLLRGGGNSGLVPEVSRMRTVGAVYRPSWFSGFQMSVDYFNIKIKNGIAIISGSSVDVLRECENSGGTSPLCALIVRPLPFSDRSAANFPTGLRNTRLNVAEENTHGFDMEVGYRFALHDLNVSYNFRAAGHDGEAYFIVNNLFDKDPRVSPGPNFAATPGANTGAVDDIMGRYFTVGLRLQY